MWGAVFAMTTYGFYQVRFYYVSKYRMLRSLSSFACQFYVEYLVALNKS